MRTRLPTSAIVGLAAAVLAIGLWAVEQLSGQMVFEILTAPAKLALLAAPFFFLADLSDFLHRRPRVAVSLGLVLIAVTLGAMAAYLPWRSAFAEHFNNGVYRWYYEGMLHKESDFAEWEKAWVQHRPHLFEAGLVLVYYAHLITLCTVWRLRHVGSAVVTMLGYALLFIGPIVTNLIAWDYDTFLMGIALDSISMDLFPVYFWHAGDYSIFLYVFMLIFFGISSAFYYLRPRHAEQC